MRPPLVLEMERPTTIAVVPMPVGMRSQRAEMLVLTDMPARRPPPSRPFHYLLHPLSVVAPLGFDVCRQVLAQHVGLHEPVAAGRQEADRHDQPQAAGLQFAGDAHAGDVRFLWQAVEGFFDLDTRHTF